MQEGKHGRRKTAIVAAASLATAAALVGWWMWTRSSPGEDRAQSALETAAGDAGAMVASAPGSGPGKAASRSPLPKGRFQDVRAELEVRARAGDARAAYRLGQVLSRCLDYKPMPGGEFTEMLVRAVARGSDNVRIGGRKLDDPDLLDMMLYAKDQADTICKDVGELPGSARKGEARAWLQLAAEQGHTKAMVEYGAFAFDDMASDGDLLDNVEEVVARRERARGYLRRAFEAGEPESLVALAAAHGSKPYLGRDPTQALAYFNAYLRTDAGRKWPRGLVNMFEEQLTADVSAAQSREAERRSLQISQAFQQRRMP